MLKPGLYEQIVNQAISTELISVSEQCKSVEKLESAKAPQALAGYVAENIRMTLEAMSQNTSEQIELVNDLLHVLAEKRGEMTEQYVDSKAERLLQVMDEKDPRRITGITAAMLPRPETPMSVSSLFTGAVNEPKMYTELRKEITSATHIDMLVSFIKWSGLRLMINELRDFCEHGGQLRVITTSYMGATEVKAVDELALLPNTKVKVSYDTKRTRLHAKTYVFYRDTGFTTAYVGSSNLTNAAMSDGLEWNLKLTAMDQPDTIRKIDATFDSYWNSNEFEDYTTDDHARLAEALKSQSNPDDKPYMFDIRPYPYQQAILDQLQAEREVRGFYRNLLVAATGTGKTVIAAMDYRNWRAAHPGTSV